MAPTLELVDVEPTEVVVFELDEPAEFVEPK